jgi:hypothetical protein
MPQGNSGLIGTQPSMSVVLENFRYVDLQLTNELIDVEWKSKVVHTDYSGDVTDRSLICRPEAVIHRVKDWLGPQMVK